MTRNPDAPWGETAEAALDLAAKEAAPRGLLETGRVFLALARVDIRGDWSRLWLHTGYPPPGALADAPDSGPAVFGAMWSDVPLSAQLEDCLSLAMELAAAYELTPIPPGVLALALIADAEAGAARTLLVGRQVTHETLLGLIEDEILGTKLEELDSFLAWLRCDSSVREKSVYWYGRAAVVAAPRPPDDVDLLRVLARDGEIDRKSNGILITEGLTYLADDARRLGTHTAEDVLTAARAELPSVEPDGQQVLLTMAKQPSPALTGLLSVAGLSAKELAAGAIERRESHAHEPLPAEVRRLTILTAVLWLVVSALVAGHAVMTRNWWELAFLPGAFLGPPLTSAWVPAVLAAALALINPVGGLAMIGAALTGWLRQRSERRLLAARTGVHLRPGEHRNYVQRRHYAARSKLRRDTLLLPMRSTRLLKLVERTGAGH